MGKHTKELAQRLLAKEKEIEELKEEKRTLDERGRKKVAKLKKRLRGQRKKSRN